MANPSWWTGASAKDPLESFKNALLPFMSPEDQRVSATQLASKNKEYASYADAPFAPAPTKVTAAMRNQYFSAERAANALTSLNNMKAARPAAYKSSAESAGYTYLADVLKTLQRLGSTQGEGMSRADYMEFQRAVDSMSRGIENNKDAQPYAELANYMINPGFSGGSLVNYRKVGNRTIYGSANNKLFS